MEPITTLCLDSKTFVFPSGISFWHVNEMTCRIALNKKAIGGTDAPLNMQDAAAAFEAWALFLHVHAQYENVQLGLQDGMTLPLWPEGEPFLLGRNLPNGEGKADVWKTYGHYNRFLYRVMNFRKQYHWFKIADTGLEQAVLRFERAFHNYLLCNNVPRTKPADEPKEPEGKVEVIFARNDLVAGQRLKEQTSVQGVNIGELYRQFPVGLFFEEKSKATQIFTANHSAIDLWGTSEDGTKLVIYELKTNNKMPGIITELMFYANYMRDMFVDCVNSCTPLPIPGKQGGKPEKDIHRGYDALLCACETLTNVHAFMLANGLDPRVTHKILDEMNQNSAGITYDAIWYDWTEGAVDIPNVKKYFE